MHLGARLKFRELRAATENQAVLTTPVALCHGRITAGRTNLKAARVRQASKVCHEWCVTLLPNPLSCHSESLNNLRRCT